MLMGFWKLKICTQATANYGKGKNKYLCELTSTKANLRTDIALLKKKSKRYIGLDMGKNGHN